MSTDAQQPVIAPGRDEARGWAEEELARPEYQESDLTFLERIGRLFTDLFDDLMRGVAGVSSPWLIVIVVVIVAALIVLVIWRVQRGSGGGLSLPRYDAPFIVPDQDPDELRIRARAAADAGDWNTAVQEGARTVMAELGRADAIEIAAASTAAELSRDAARARPGHRDDLLWTGRIFDSVTFGDGTAREQDWERVARLDAELRKAGVR